MKRTDVQLVIFTVFVIASFIEFSYGSKYLGALFATVSFIILLKFPSRMVPTSKADKSLSRKVLGFVIIAAVLYYNLSTGSEFRTLDSFLVLLGASIIMTGTGAKKLSELGYFTFYLSFIFLVLFSGIYVLPGMLGVKLPYYYGHYFVTLPVAGVLRAAGLSLEVVAMNQLYVGNMTNGLIGLDMACYGFYSMFLIISAAAAYGITTKIELRMLLSVLLILIFASYAANFLRVFTLIVLAYYYGVDTMLLVHSHLGWMFFGFILLPLMYLSLRR